MSSAVTQKSSSSRWLNWQPQGRIIKEPPRTEPTKPTKPGFVGFVGSTLSTSQNIAPLDSASKVSAGKALIAQTNWLIAAAWKGIDSDGSLALEGYLRGSAHGPKIQAAEDRVNAVGSMGDPAALSSACNAWVNAWREGIEGWKKAHGSTKVGFGRICDKT